MKRPSLYNNKLFADVTFTLTPSGSESISLSRLHLSRKSSYFSWLFRTFSSLNTFLLPLKEEKERRALIKLLKLLYGEEENTLVINQPPSLPLPSPPVINQSPPIIPRSPSVNFQSSLDLKQSPPAPAPVINQTPLINQEKNEKEKLLLFPEEKNEMNEQNENMMIVYQVALKFDISEIFENYFASIEEISELAQFLEDLKELGVGEYKQNISFQTTPTSSDFKAAILFRKKSSEIINNKFKTITDILDHKKEFLNLHATGLEVILKNELFQRDSENSIITILLMWIRENRSKREKYLKGLLPLVDMGEMTNYFLINLMPSVLAELENNDLKEEFRRAYIRALEDKNHIFREQGYKRQIVKRSTFYESSHEKFAMKVEFRKISEWKINEKYYSQPIFSNGFFFYFFMRVETNTSDQSQYLAGYLRCTSEVTSLPNHYLPVTVTFEILLSNSKTRKFPPVSVVFDHFDRSIGSRMNQPTENWEKIRFGQSDIVKDDKITVIISVDFKS